MSLSEEFFRAYDVKFLPSSEFSCSEKLVLMVLLSMRNLQEIFISHKNLGEQCSISVPTVKRVLNKLKLKNVLMIKKRGDGKTLKYDLDIKILLVFVFKSNPEQFKKLEKHFGVSAQEVQRDSFNLL